MSLVMPASLGSFPLAVAASGVVIGHLGLPLFFPAGGALIATAILGALMQREFRDFGSAQPPAGEFSGRARPRQPVPPGPAGGYAALGSAR
jgi:hypothetical protein